MYRNRYVFVFTVKNFEILIEMIIINRVGKIYNYIVVRLLVMLFLPLFSFTLRNIPVTPRIGTFS
jgi:cell shape-determining protein MreD